MRRFLLASFALAALACAPIAQAAAPAPATDATEAKPAQISELVDSVDLPYSQFTLDNGLRVVVHTDRKAPVVAVAVWYHVGSKDEPAGRTGFAHLYEHLMFGGSQHSDTSWFVPMQAMGATHTNGNTHFDRTRYFETVPRGALERALFLESDRMGFLLPAVTQKKLDTQRGVVQNEKRQDDNQPGGLLQYAVLQTLYPAGNPYHHTVIGSMKDLDGASLEVVKDWFRSHYGPNNAVLVLAGDISADEAKPLVEKYFGAIPRGPQPRKVEVPVPTLPAPVTKVFRDEVANTEISRMWAVPGLTDPDRPALDVAARILGGLASSRLDNQLVRGKETAVSVSAGNYSLEKGGQFSVDATVKPGVDPALVGKQVDAIIADFIANGPTEDEVRRAKMSYIASDIRGLESVSGQAAALATGAVYEGDPGYYKKELEAWAALTPAQVQAAAKKWLSRPVFAYTLEPGERGAYEESKLADDTASGAPAAQTATAQTEAETLPGDVDRTKLPPIGQIADLTFPKVVHATLANGIPVEFARRAGLPIVRVAMTFDAGNAADPRDKLGTQAFMLSLLDQGTDKYDATQIAEKQEDLGAIISAAPSMDRSTASVSALAPNLAPSLGLMADIVRHPAFRPADVERGRAQQLAAIAAETKNPIEIALRMLPPMLYGKVYPYGVPYRGTGDPAAVKKLTPADIEAFHQEWLRPGNATIFVVGDTTLADVMPLLEKSFGDWHVQGTAPVKDFDVPTAPQKGRIVVVDRPNTPQSLILGGELLPAKGTDDLNPLLQANDVLGGEFTSRLNMDVRESKHWAYGVQSFLLRPKHIVPFLVYAPVQTDKTGASITAMLGDMKAFLGDDGVKQAEFERTIEGSIRELPGQFQTGSGVLSGMINNNLWERPDDYYSTLASRYRALTPAQLDAAAKAAIDPSKLTWVVIGDRKAIDPQLETLGIPIEYAAADSNVSDNDN